MVDGTDSEWSHDMEEMVLDGFLDGFLDDFWMTWKIHDVFFDFLDGIIFHEP